MSESNGYIGRSPGDSSIVLAQEYFQPTGAGKTFLFSSGYDPGYVDVYRNGVKLINVLDYAATDGKNIVLDTPVGVGSTVQVVAYKAFNLGTVESSANDFTVGTNLFVQSGFGSFGQGITANEIDVSGIGTIGIGSFVDIHVSGGATVAGTLVANAFSGDGSSLTNVTGIVTANIVSVAITTKDINVSAAATITGALSGSTGTFSGAINIDATTASTSTSTGALIVDGGVGIAKDVFVGDAIDVAKDLKVGAAASFTGIVTTTGDLYVGDSIDVAKDALVGAAATIAGIVKITDSTSSTSTSTGALIVSGGAGIAGDVWIGAGLSVAGTLTHEDVTSIDSVGMVTAKNGVNITGGELTVGSGITMGIAGVATFSGTADVHLLDNVKLNIGDGPDLQLSHSGTNSVIDNNTGGLYIRNNVGGDVGGDIYIQAKSGENSAIFTHDGSAALHYDNSVKFATTNDGTSTTGIATASLGFNLPDGAAAAGNASIDVGSSGDFQIWHHSNNHTYFVNNNSSGQLIIGSNLTKIMNEDVNETCAEFNENGNVELYYDNSKKWETTNDGTVTTGIGTFTNGIRLPDDVMAKFGTDEDLKIRHQSGNSIISHGGAGDLLINTGAGEKIYIDTSEVIFRNAASDETLIKATENSDVELYFNDSLKLATTNEGAKITGFTSTTAGMGVTGGLFEGAFIKAGKLSDNATIGIATANIFYFTTQENTTITPNITWSDTHTLSSKMNVGDVATVTVIATAAAGGYAANWAIDGNGVTEEWVGGSAPSAGGDDGLDIYTFTIIKTGTGTGDSGWKVIANVTNAT